ncbi:hypothetical protein ACHAXA_008678 [Cyclostephanos tholiformis]|uniref:[histone H3]-lysine(4) N-trimethyltransferase n=1 Tax=Cyclostephanos tholiformis TaxID=382380 RepID=A0ABD3RX65_9STRA
MCTGQVDRRYTDMDATGITEKMGGTKMEGGMPNAGDVANGDACRRGDTILSQAKSRALVAALTNDRKIIVKIKLGSIEFLAPSKESRPSKDPQENHWFCYTCQRTNLSTKKRCKNCQSWSGVNRKIAAEEAKKSDAPSNEKAEEGKAIEPSERDGDQDEAMGARLPKRKRTNLYSSLSPAVIQATTMARTESYAANLPSRPQLGSRSSKRKQSYDKKDDYDNSDVATAEKLAAVTDGAVSNELIGNDGNLFYCRTCMGVGEVVCCDGCPNVVHPRCLPPGPSKSSLEDDDNPWFCHECWENGRAITAKKQRKAKERCSYCGRKETKAQPCVPCPKRNCDNFFHLVCPSEDGDETVIEESPQRLVCTSCKAAGVGKNGSYLRYCHRQGNEEQRELLSFGRGRGRGGKCGKIFRRMSSSDERKTKLKDLSECGVNTMRRSRSSYSSGFQSPYVEKDDNDNEIGPHSLAYVEKPISSIPAFFFFLLHNRSVLEKSLSRASPFFRGMAKGLTRNEKVAQEGAAIWIGMSHKERSEWVNVSMKDFEQRVVAWKEKEVIEAMIQSMDVSQRGIDSKNELNVLPDSDTHIANSFARIRFNKVNSPPVKVSATKNGNIPLLELLNDARFRPLPLVDKTRANEDLAQRKARVSIEQFTPQGPVESSLGDECMGCTRGWSHFCSVLKRPLPSSEHRAKLQPPVSSLSATRIGLGLKINLPRDEDQTWELTDEVKNAVGLSDICPNYQPRDSFFLSTPSLRLDDTVAFIENATAITNAQSKIFSSTIGTPHSHHEFDDSSPGKSKALARGLLPLQGRRKNSLDENSAPTGLDSVSGPSVDREQMRHYKCGRFDIVQSNQFRRNNCRKSQLITHMAKRSYCSSSVAGDFLKRNSSVNSPSYGNGFIKPMCVMLGRSNPNNIIGRNKHRDGLSIIGISLTKESWTPNVILPPKPKPLPTAGHLRLHYQAASDIGKSAENRQVNYLVSWICSKCSQMNDELSNRCLNCQGRKHRESGKGNLPRSCSSKVGNLDVSHDRHALALKHKDDANELYRKCLVIACCGVLAGMVRRDPMRLFAEPVPADIKEYHQVIQDPIDFSTMRKKIQSYEYKSFGSFIADARRLCINACVFNSADSLYAKTANEIYDAVEIMHDRAKKWLAIIKNTHASSFIANEDGKNEGETYMFNDVKVMWSGAVELINDGDWLKRLSTSDFTRTRENEVAYYGSLAIRRAAIAAKASLVTVFSDMSEARQPVVKRTHTQDELLRKLVDDAAALHVGPIELKDEPDWREVQLLKLLKRVQKRRIEERLSSESGCARCDGVKTSDETNKTVTLLRSDFKRTVDATRTRVAASRLPQNTGLASRNAREMNAEKSIAAGAPLEFIRRVATECMVSVRGSRIHGWGLFADGSFKKGEVIAEYIGEYVSDAVADLREKRYSEQRMQDYQFRVDGSLVIDATLRGGYARYINHSCTPNCESKIVDGTPPREHLKRVLIISQRNINASEELTYDYNFPLEMNLDLRIPCNCGSRQCRGFMNWDIPEKSYRHTTKVGKTARRGRIL